MDSGDVERMKLGIQIEKKAEDMLYKLMPRLGLDLNSRLKFAALKVEREQDAIEEEFGDI